MTADTRTLASTGRALDTRDVPRARRIAGPRCALCERAGTHPDPDPTVAWRYCAEHLVRLHDALAYRANVAAGAVAPRARVGVRELVTRGVPSAARKAAGAANQAAGRAP